MGVIGARIVEVLRWLLLAAMVLGPVMAVLGWFDERRIRDVEANGIETTATIDRATRNEGRLDPGGYVVKIAWQDADGQSRRATALRISSVLASQLVRDDKLIRQTVRIKYLPDPGSLPILLEDAGRYEEQEGMVKVGLAAFAIGLIGCGFFFFAIGRRRPERVAS